MIEQQLALNRLEAISMTKCLQIFNVPNYDERVVNFTFNLFECLAF